MIFLATGTIGIDHPDRVLLWVIAQGAISLVAAASSSAEEAALRTFVPQIATTTTVAFLMLRDQMDPAAIVDPVTLAFVFMLAAIAGAMGGAALGVVQWSLLLAVRNAGSVPSHDGIGRAGQAACARLAVANTLTLGMVAVREPSLAWIAAVGILAPTFIAAGCIVQRDLLRRWTRRVEAGAVEGWAIVPMRTEWSRLDLRPLFTPAHPAENQRVLVRTARARRPFRSADWVLPVALVGHASSDRA